MDTTTRPPRPEVYCNAECAHGGTCTLESGHAGNHEAWAVEYLRCSWPQATQRTEFGHDVHTDASGDTWCTACGMPVRYSTAYDEPHYVHIRIADTVACPMYASAR